MDENVNAIRLVDKKGILGKPGEVYELDFSRESILFAETKDFELESITKKPVKKIPELFYMSFRMHHKNIAKNKTDEFMEKAWRNTLPESILTRLCLLFNQAQLGNSISLDEEDDGKNEFATVEM